MNRPPEQTYFDGMKPTDEPDVEEVKQAIYLWLDARVSQKRASEETKQKHAQMLAALAENGLDWHPYLDPFTQKKKRAWIAKEPKVKTSSVPKPPGERGRKKRGGPDRDDDAIIAPDDDDKVETRRVPRESVEKEIDPFGSVRAALSGGVLEQAEAAQGAARKGEPFSPPKLQTRAKGKRGK